MNIKCLKDEEIGLKNLFRI